MRLSCIERPQSIPVNHSHSCNENWFSDKKDYDQKGDPEAIFNVLDSILKSSLDRLASLRFSNLLVCCIHGNFYLRTASDEVYNSCFSL